MEHKEHSKLCPRSDGYTDCCCKPAAQPHKDGVDKELKRICDELLCIDCGKRKIDCQAHNPLYLQVNGEVKKVINVFHKDKREEWEDRFDEIFRPIYSWIECSEAEDLDIAFKAFIRSLLTQRDAALREAILALPNGGNLIDIENGPNPEAIYKHQVLSLINNSTE